jgi:hypothetical protein
MKNVIAAFAVLLVIPALGFAQETVSGSYVNFNLEQTVIERPDGTSLVHSTVDQYSTTMDPANPMNDMKFRCTGLDVVSPSGEVMSSGGACFGNNPDGDSQWHWWRRTEVGTEECPLQCGVWTIFHGTGAFAEMTGSGGTWKVTAVFPDETDAGTWTLK